MNNDKIITLSLFATILPGLMLYKLGLVVLYGDICLGFVLSLSILYGARHNINLMNKYTRWVIIYAVVCSISMFFNAEHRFGAMASVLVGPMLCIYIMVHGFRDRDWLINAFLLLAVLQVATGLVQLARADVFDNLFAEYIGEYSRQNSHFIIGRIGSIWSESPRYGTVLAALLPYSLHALCERRIKSIYGSVFILLCVGIVMTATRVAFFSMLVMIIIYFWRRRSARSILLLLAVLFMVIVVILPAILNLKEVNLLRLFDRRGMIADYIAGGEYNRIGMIHDVLPGIFKSPLIGQGYRLQAYLRSGYSSVHNWVLHSVLVFGFPATLLLIFMVYKVLRVVLVARMRVNSDSAFYYAGAISALAIFAAGFFHGVVFDIWINRLMWLGLGLGLRQYSVASPYGTPFREA